MSETSFFWSGQVTGDASNADYDHLEFTKVYNKFLTSDGAGYVIPGYANSLNVQASSPVAASVDVRTGAAIVQGFLYENDSLTTLAVPANASGNPRIDRIILRVNFAAQTIRVALLQGTAAAAPTAPALTQTYGTTWEVALAQIWVANGFATITDTEIHDTRSFIMTAASVRQRSSNLVGNSEFILVETSVPNNPHVIHGVWNYNNVAPLTWGSATRPSQQTRGKAVTLGSPAGTAGELSQIIPCKASTVYTLRGLINTPAAGAEIEIQTNGGGFATVLKRTIRQVNTWVDEQLIITTGGSDTFLKIIYRGVILQTVQFGQAIVVEGYHAGDFTPVHEFIPCTQDRDLTGYSATAKSSGSTAVDLSATAFSGVALFEAQDLRAVALRVAGNDSGSAAGAPRMLVRPGAAVTTNPISLILDGVVNDKVRSIGGIVNVMQRTFPDTYLPEITIDIVASGGSTFDATVALVGIYT